MREPGAALQGEWLAVALRVFFRPEQALGIAETYELTLGNDVFHVVVDDGSLEVGSGPASEPDLVLEADVDTMLALLEAPSPPPRPWPPAASEPKVTSSSSSGCLPSSPFASPPSVDRNCSLARHAAQRDWSEADQEAAMLNPVRTEASGRSG